MRLPMLALSLLALGCAPAATTVTAHDSVGDAFTLSCSDICTVTSGPSIDPVLCTGVGPGWGWIGGRFFAVCAYCGTATISGRCRPLACDTDVECPGFGTETYECVDGLCQHTDEVLYPRDVLSPFAARIMCYADLPRDASESVVQEAVLTREAAMSETCPITAESCTLPPECSAP